LAVFGKAFGKGIMISLQQKRLLKSEAALTLLTKYCLTPDKGLECFAEMALEECAMWNE